METLLRLPGTAELQLGKLAGTFLQFACIPVPSWSSAVPGLIPFPASRSNLAARRTVP
jgi:hypothetical protein